MPVRILTLIGCLSIAAPLAAQPQAPSPSSGAPTVAVDGLIGYAAFVDDSPIEHSVFGAAVRVHLAPHHSVGPEIVYMNGPRLDRDWFLTFNYVYDFLAQGAGRPRHRINPFVVAGGGFMHHQDAFVSGFSSSEGAFTAGGGARVRITDRLYALGEFRLGLELHYRVNGGIGFTWR